MRAATTIFVCIFVAVQAETFVKPSEYKRKGSVFFCNNNNNL